MLKTAWKWNLEKIERGKSLIQVYVKHLTQKDLEAASAFYRSESGKRFIEKQPAIMRESMIFGQQWGAKLGASVAQKIQEKSKEQGLKL